MVRRDLALGEPARRRHGSHARIVVDEHELDARAQPGGTHRALQRPRRGIVAGARDQEHAVGLAEAPLRPWRPRVIRLEHDMAVRALARGEPCDDRRVCRIAVVSLGRPRATQCMVDGSARYRPRLAAARPERATTRETPPTGRRHDGDDGRAPPRAADA